MKLSELKFEKLSESEKFKTNGGQQPGSYGFGYSLGSTARDVWDLLSLSFSVRSHWRML